MSDNDTDRATENPLAAVAFWCFFVVYLAPAIAFSLVLYPFFSGSDPGSYTKFFFVMLANHDEALGILYKLVVAGLGIAIPLSTKQLKPLALAILLTVLTVVVLYCIISSYVLKTPEASELAYQNNIFGLNEDELKSKTTLSLNAVAGYFTEILQTVLLVIATMTGIKLGK